MKKKRKTPTNKAGAQREIDIVGMYKDKYSLLTPSDQKVLKLLEKGEPMEQKEIGQRLNLADARAHIRNLRNAGIPVSDKPHHTGFSTRKMYFLKTI